MATLQTIAKEISRMAGIPDSTLRTVARRLGESGLLPRGGPGTKPHNATALDCTRMIIGAMSVADGISGTVARVDRQVSEVERLETTAKIHFASGDTAAAIEEAILVVSPGSFARQLESLIRRLGTDEKTQLLEVVAAVGLTMGANRTWGWVERRSGVELVHEGDLRLHHESGVSRIVFADGDIDCSGFTREVRMTSEALCKIASLCRDGSEAQHG
jgi:hypothetical protein